MAPHIVTNQTPTAVPSNDDAPALTSDTALLEIATPRTLEAETGAGEPPAIAEIAPRAAKSRRKARVIALSVLGLLGVFIAWYPLSDHNAPYSGGGSIIAEVTAISSRVSGPVSEMLVSDNAQVTKGQTLFHIDDTTFRMDVDQAQAQLDQMINTVSSSGAAIPAAEAKLQQAQVALTTADQDLERSRQLFDKGLVTSAKLTQLEASYQTALLAVSAAEAELTRARATAGTLDGNNPNLRAAQANLEKAQFALANTSVVAPADGYVTNLTLTPGQYLTAGSAAMTFINPATQMVIADFRENQLINVQPGDKAVVVFEGAPGRQFEATVDSVAWGISSGRTSTNGLAQSTTDARWFPPARKIPVRLSLDNLDELPRNVRLGSEAGALIIPEPGFIPAVAKAMLGVSGFFSGFN